MEITKKENINEGYVGIWKTGEHTGVVHVYGFSNVTHYFNDPQKMRSQFKNKSFDDEFINYCFKCVCGDFEHKVKIMIDEDKYLPQADLYNYGRFFDRYITKANVSCFEDAVFYGKPHIENYMNINDKRLMHFFGRGEFPFIEVYFVLRETDELYVCYFSVNAL